ncbi:MAG: hypothetical protein ACOX6O_06145 [Christensenellales bacterium]
MTNYTGLRGHVYQVDNQPIASGGEGLICPITSDGTGNLLAKLFKPTMNTQALHQKAAKLVAMVQMKTDSVSQHIAWPQDVLMDNSNVIRGFVMRRMPNTTTMAEVVSSKAFNSWRKRLILAANLCDVVSEVHSLRQVIGDMQPQNFGVDQDKGYCYAFDADSFHIMDTQGRYHPCVVGLAEYFAPELQAKMKQGLKMADLNPADTFTQQTDLFALGVLLFQILFMGFHPFTGRVVETADSSVFMSTSENINRLRSPYFNPPPGMAPPAGAPPVSILPLSTQVLFHNALLTFDRPTAKEWHQEIIKIIGSLSVCSRGHEYHKENGACPWCALERGSASKSATKKSTPQATPVSTAQQNMQTPQCQQVQVGPIPAQPRVVSTPTQPQVAHHTSAANTAEKPQNIQQNDIPDDRPLWKMIVHGIALVSLWLFWLWGSIYLSCIWFKKSIEGYKTPFMILAGILSIPCLISSFRPPALRGVNIFHNLHYVLKNGRYIYYFVGGIILFSGTYFLFEEFGLVTQDQFLESAVPLITYFAARAIAYMLIPEKAKNP